MRATVGAERWRSLVAQYFPASAVTSALTILHCESSANPETVGDLNTPYPSYGLMQIRALPGRKPANELIKPAVNIREAHRIWLGEGERFGTTGGWYNCAKRTGIY